MNESNVGEMITKITNKKILFWLPAGIVTTPQWLFDKFTSSSLAKHGIRRVSRNSRVLLAGQDDRVEYVVQLDKSDRVARISKDTPITYLGFRKWE